MNAPDIVENETASCVEFSYFHYITFRVQWLNGFSRTRKNAQKDRWKQNKFQDRSISWNAICVQMLFNSRSIFHLSVFCFLSFSFSVLFMSVNAIMKYCSWVICLCPKVLSFEHKIKTFLFSCVRCLLELQVENRQSDANPLVCRLSVCSTLCVIHALRWNWQFHLLRVCYRANEKTKDILMNFVSTYFGWRYEIDEFR